MTSKLKIIPLGGLGEIGKNMTVIEFGSDLILIDCGMGFPDEDMYGIDVVLPDITYLKNNASRIRGMIITHGHEDHIGAVPYVLKELDIPISHHIPCVPMEGHMLDEFFGWKAPQQDPGYEEDVWNPSEDDEEEGLIYDGD